MEKNENNKGQCKGTKKMKWEWNKNKRNEGQRKGMKKMKETKRK